MAHVWEMYASKFANDKIKDHIHEVTHKALLRLPWRKLTPTMSHLEQMVRIMDTYVPICHEFVGRVFCEIAWFRTVTEQPYGRAMIPGLLRLIVKLAFEPQIRQVRLFTEKCRVQKKSGNKFLVSPLFFQVGRLQQLMTEAQSLPWWEIDSDSFESLMQWFVMSVDPKIIIGHEQRHALDLAVLR